MAFCYSKKSLFQFRKTLATVGGSFDSGNFEKSKSEVIHFQKIFSQFVENLPLKNEANSVFYIISNCLDPRYIRKQDLSITFMSKTGEKNTFR